MKKNDFAVYVDKTAYIHSFISNYKTVFFAHPRRFGKSLTCSTIKAIFENQRDLFRLVGIHKFREQGGVYASRKKKSHVEKVYGKRTQITLSPSSIPIINL